jgi:hypothetical protein
LTARGSRLGAFLGFGRGGLPILAILLLSASPACAAGAPAPVAPAAQPVVPAAAPAQTDPAATGGAAEAAAAPAAPDSTVPAPAPATGVTARDKPGDEGKHIVVTWKPSSDDGAGARTVFGYEVLRAPSADGPFTPTGVKAPAGKTEAVDEVPANGTDYWYAVRAATAGGAASDSAPVGPARSSPQWFNPDKTSVAVFTVIFCVATAVVLSMARRGAKFYIRPIGGINAIDEAIGRATEMGKPILFVPGLLEAGDPPTLAAFSIMGRVAKKVAEYQSAPDRYPATTRWS